MAEYDTLAYYENNADTYCSQTRDWDLSGLYDLFEKHLPANAYILDFGCGSGRDSKYFLEHGYRVRAVDGSKAMCQLASDFTNQEVELLRFEQLADLNIYDGIWACSSILHVEREKLPDIFTKMLKALKPGGVIYTSFKIGKGFRIKENKLYTEFTPKNLEMLIDSLPVPAKITEYTINVSRKRSRPGSNQWGNYIIQKSPTVL